MRLAWGGSPAAVPLRRSGAIHPTQVHPDPAPTPCALPSQPVGAWSSLMHRARHTPAGPGSPAGPGARARLRQHQGKHKSICTTRTNTSPSHGVWQELAYRREESCCQEVREEGSRQLASEHKARSSTHAARPTKPFLPPPPFCSFPIQGNHQPRRETNEGLRKLLLTFGDQLSICASTYAKQERSRLRNEAPSGRGDCRPSSGEALLDSDALGRAKSAAAPARSHKRQRLPPPCPSFPRHKAVSRKRCVPASRLGSMRKTETLTLVAVLTSGRGTRTRHRSPPAADQSLSLGSFGLD